MRANSFIEVMDALLQSPWPTPRGFFTIKSLPVANLQLIGNPVDVAHTSISTTTKDDDEAAIITVSPGLPFTIFAIGNIPEYFTLSCDVHFSQVIAWYTISFDGPLDRDDEVEEDRQDENEREAIKEEKESGFITESSETPMVSSLLPSGKYALPIDLSPINQEGYYLLEVKLGCRDIQYGQWEIPTVSGTSKIVICVTAPHDSDEVASVSGL